MIGLSEFSISSARAVDAVYNEFILRVIEESEGGDDIHCKNKLFEVFSCLGVSIISILILSPGRTEHVLTVTFCNTQLMTMYYYCTNHSDRSDKLGGTFDLRSAKAKLSHKPTARKPTARKPTAKKASQNNFHKRAYGLLGRNIIKCKAEIQKCESNNDFSNGDRISNSMRSISHVIRSGLYNSKRSSGPDSLSNSESTESVDDHLPKFAVKASCGYLVRLKGKAANMQLRAYFAYTQTGVAVELEGNRMVYNVFDSQLEHQTCLPFVTDGMKVYPMNEDAHILAWGCGKSARESFNCAHLQAHLH